MPSVRGRNRLRLSPSQTDFQVDASLDMSTCVYGLALGDRRDKQFNYAIPVQCSANSAIKPTGSGLFCEFVINSLR